MDFKKPEDGILIAILGMSAIIIAIAAFVLSEVFFKNILLN